MFYEVLQGVRGLATTFAAPYTFIDHGAMPADNSLAMFPGPGMTSETHLDKGIVYDLLFALNGKHESLNVLVSALSNIHTGLAQLKVYLIGSNWQILDIETATLPNYLDREHSGTRQWLYGSLIRVKVYVKGEC